MNQEPRNDNRRSREPAHDSEPSLPQLRGVGVPRCLLVIVVLLFTLLGHEPVAAHPMSFGSARVVVEDGGLEAELVLDVPDSVLRQPERQRRRELEQQVSAGFEIDFAAGACEPPRILQLGAGEAAVDVVRVRCRVPDGVRAARITSSRELGDLAVEWVVQRAGHRAKQRVVLDAGETSRPLLLVPAKPGSGDVDPQATEASTSATTSSRVSTPVSSTPVSSTPVTSTSGEAGGGGVLDFLRLGFWHIVPDGIDHMLFLATLLLLVARWQSLLLLFTLFTAGHAVSLTWSSVSGPVLSAAWIEPLIALSLAYGALEVHAPRLAPMRAFVVLGFGLIHGLGFAGALLRIALPSEQRLPALLGFNLGVELGQIAVAIVPWLLLDTWRRRVASNAGTDTAQRGAALERFRVGSLRAIAALGVGWALLRVIS